MIAALREELVGPSPRGKEIDTTANLAFDTYAEAQGPFRQATNGDEILTGDRPTKRYGVGVLYPWRTELDADPDGESEDDPGTLDAIEADAEAEASREDAAAPLAARSRVRAPEDDDDLPLSTANSYRPSSFGLSFLSDLSDVASLEVELTGARYRERDVGVQSTGSAMTWWLRDELKVTATFSSADLLAGASPGTRRLVSPAGVDGNLPADMHISITALSRPRGDGKTLLTVSAVNRSQNQSADAVALFQAQLDARPSPGWPSSSPTKSPSGR